MCTSSHLNFFFFSAKFIFISNWNHVVNIHTATQSSSKQTAAKLHILVAVNLAGVECNTRKLPLSSTTWFVKVFIRLNIFIRDNRVKFVHISRDYGNNFDNHWIENVH